MKESQFNTYFLADDSTPLAFNSLTCALAIIDESYQSLLSILPSLSSIKDVPENLVSAYNNAITGHFIIPDDADELKELLLKRNLQKYSTNSLGLTIAPTLECNFKCLYCYETSTPGIMSKETADNVVYFVKKAADKIKFLSVTWYGGEPLLAFSFIKQLTEEFLIICKDKSINYSASMITNGSLLDEGIIDEMAKLKISRIQLTVDGPKRIHDERRKSKNSKSSYDTILSSIKKLIKKDIKVYLRINIDKTNESYITELLSDLDSYLNGNKIDISFAKVSAFTEHCCSIEPICFQDEEFALKSLSYYDLLVNHSYVANHLPPYPRAKLNYCGAELFHSYVIDSNGNVHKCWNTISNPQMAIGNINDENFKIDNSKHAEWLLRDILENDECKICSFLPLCLGGCPYSKVIKGINKVCDLTKYNIREILKKYYDNSITKK